LLEVLMARESDVELEVWRTVGRHFGFEEVVGPIAQLLGRRLAIDVVVVRRLVPEHGRIDTVAAASCHSDEPVSCPRTPCPAETMSRLVSWCRDGDVRVAEPGEDPVVDILAPVGSRGSTLACPLTIAGHAPGAVLLISRRPHSLDSSHRFVATHLVEPLTAALEHQIHLQELARLKESLEADRQALLNRLQRDDIVESLVGCDAGLRGVMQRVEQVAPTDTTVLLLGETGTGKEVVARAIHAASRRESGPMVRVNCGAIPAELVDSELFGHERGSFTGAVALRKGWFERADGGTLFLDEIGELPLPAQVRLLRILQDGTLERVGGQQSLTVDVRIVAATNQELEAMVSAGRFREDLWYRISVFPIRIPSLRERRDDIPALAAHFAARAGRRLGPGPLVPGEHDIRLLLQYGWPGNVRELASVIERAAILGNGRRLEIAAALGSSEGPTDRNPPAPIPEESELSLSALGFATIDQAMARHIENALTLSHGRIEGAHGAARLLGINPHTLRARMRKLGIDWARFRTSE
jgi:hydrogenase-4 transcriptional activator